MTDAINRITGEPRTGAAARCSMADAAFDFSVAQCTGFSMSISEQGVAMSIAAISVCCDTNEISGHRYAAMAIAETTIDKTMRAAMLRRQEDMIWRIDGRSLAQNFLPWRPCHVGRLVIFCMLFVKSHKV